MAGFNDKEREIEAGAVDIETGDGWVSGEGTFLGRVKDLC